MSWTDEPLRVAVLESAPSPAFQELLSWGGLAAGTFPALSGILLMVQPKNHHIFFSTSAPGMMMQEFPSWTAQLCSQILCAPEFLQAHPSQTLELGAAAAFPHSFPIPAARRIPVHPSIPSQRSCLSPGHPGPTAAHSNKGSFISLGSSRTGGSRDCSHSHVPAKESEGIPCELQDGAVE